MSPLLEIMRLCMEQYAHLTEDEIRALLSAALKMKGNMREKNTVAVRRKTPRYVTPRRKK